LRRQNQRDILQLQRELKATNELVQVLVRTLPTANEAYDADTSETASLQSDASNPSMFVVERVVESVVDGASAFEISPPAEEVHRWDSLPAVIGDTSTTEESSTENH